MRRTRPASYANTTTWARSRAPSLVMARLTCVLAVAGLTRDYTNRDVDGDGKLSESEFASNGSTPPPTDDAGKKKP